MDKISNDPRENIAQSILFAIEEDVIDLLPNSFYSDFDLRMNKIVSLLEKEIRDTEYVKSCSDDINEINEYNKEIDSLKKKLNICMQRIDEVHKEREEDFSEKEDTEDLQKINIIFGINPAGNVSFFNDIKKNIEPHRFKDVSKLLEEMRAGKLDKENHEKGKKMAHNSKLAGVDQKKGYQLRILYKTLPNHMIYVMMIRHKKDDRESLDSAEPIARTSLLSSDYEKTKKDIKMGKIDDYLSRNEQVYDEIQSFLKNYSLGGKRL